MLRVLHCIYDDPGNPWLGGGGAMRVPQIYRRLAGQVDATVATGNYPGAQDQVVDGIRYVRLGSASPYAWSRWTYARAATRRLRRAAYDVGIYDFSVYTPIRLPRGRPTGVIVHMPIGPTATRRWGPALGRMVAIAERLLLRNARRICATSAWTREQLREVVPADARIDLVRSGVDDEFFRIERQEQNYVLYYGRFDLFQKGLDTLLEAAAILFRTRPELELRIAGRGKDLDQVQSLARELSVADRIRVHTDPSREQVGWLFSGALALLMPSRFEGMPIVPAEAMAAGVPVVGAAVSGIPEVVSAPHGGVLVPPDDAEALAEAVARLLDDPERRHALSRSARRAAERFSWTRAAEGHLAFLQHVATGSDDDMKVDSE